MKRKDAETVAKALLNLIHRHGAPERLLTDRGMEFQARLTKVMLEELGIRGVCLPLVIIRNVMERSKGYTEH